MRIMMQVMRTMMKAHAILTRDTRRAKRVFDQDAQLNKRSRRAAPELAERFPVPSDTRVAGGNSPILMRGMKKSRGSFPGSGWAFYLASSPDALRAASIFAAFAAAAALWASLAGALHDASFAGHSK